MAMYCLTVLSIGLCIIFYLLYARDHSRLKLKEEIGDRLDGGDGLDHVVTVASEHLSNFGVFVLGFYRKNRVTMHLESEKGVVPMLEPSVAVKALFNQEPYYSDNRYEVDRKVCESLAEKRIAFIPLRMKGSNHCWQVHIHDVRYAFDMTVKKAGLKNIHPHDLRKTFSTRLDECRVPLHINKALMGHSTNDVTEKHYIHRVVESLRPYVRLLDGYYEKYGVNLDEVLKLAG